MSTLIYASDGDQCIGKCDATCYNATGPDCDCICGGRNHGVGLKQATENTREYAEEWMEKYSAEKKISIKDIQVNQEIYQLKLF
jgi:hypothetical protein